MNVRIARAVSVIGCALALWAVTTVPASAQGCVCQKQGSPVFGGLETYLQGGQFQVTIGYRGYRSTEHFRGTAPFPDLDPNGPINRQHALVGELTYGLSSRWNVAVNAPWYSNGFAVRRAGPASSTRYFQDTPVAGLGDLGARTSLWLFSTENPFWNVGVSGGVKFGNGASDRTGTVGGRVVPVDVSIQMGDGSVGYTASAQAFRDFDRLSLYGTFQYLFSPENTTGTPTFFGSLNNPNNSTLNSVADQYSSQIGVAYQVKRGWPVPSLAFRVEGVPVADVFGASDGFRRPGTITFFEPGINMQLPGANLVTFSVAIRSWLNIRDSPTSTRIEDATVPGHMFFLGFSRRL